VLAIPAPVAAIGLSQLPVATVTTVQWDGIWVLLCVSTDDHPARNLIAGKIIVAVACPRRR
jgi:hypothetical protein